MRLLVLLAFVAVASAIFPGKNWIRQAPDQAGFDPAKLKAAVDYATKGIETYCVSIHRNGYLISDKYFGPSGGYNKTNIIWSVSKAWMATMMGVAERDGKVSTTDLMTKYVPEWNKADTRNISVDHIMRHCSGRYYDAVTDFVTPQTQTDQTAFSIKLAQQHPPGTKDQYNQMAYQTLQQVFEKSTGRLLTDATKQELFTPLQFESQSLWQEKGFFTGVPQKHPLVYGGMTTSCPDLARFGHLWLNRGNWSGRVVFTGQFFDKALSQPQFSFGPGRRYGNWGGGPSHKSEGLGRQIVVFNPSNGIVMTRVGSEATSQFNPGQFMDLVAQSVKSEELRGSMDDWFVAM